jgi:hypothetical protein
MPIILPASQVRTSTLGGKVIATDTQDTVAAIALDVDMTNKVIVTTFKSGTLAADGSFAENGAGTITSVSIDLIAGTFVAVGGSQLSGAAPDPLLASVIQDLVTLGQSIEQAAAEMLTATTGEIYTFVPIAMPKPIVTPA